MLSLNSRVLLAASAVLASFFGLAGFTLDRVYVQSAEDSLRDHMQGKVHALIASADIDDEGRIFIHEFFPDQNYSVVLPTLYAQITVDDGEVIWRTPSLLDVNIKFTTKLQRNEESFRQVTLSNGEKYATYSLGVAWDDITDGYIFIFSMAENLASMHEQIRHFRQNLWGWLGGVALVLLAVQGTILRWGLAPLQTAANELSAIETGTQKKLEYPYPGEMKRLTDNLNALLEHQQEHLERYRHTLGDLAHSLKTPLAVLQSATDEDVSSTKLRKTVQEQLQRMNQITEYQLQRAATAGQSPLKAPVSIYEIVNKVLNSLNKVYADKGVNSEFDVDKLLVFHGDESDLMEVIGNLADNAFKWCKGYVAIKVDAEKDPHGQSTTIAISVEDDGPGIPDEMINQVVQRGVRADQGISGHGIGLSVVQDIAQIYGGKLEIRSSKHNGALITATLKETVQ